MNPEVLKDLYERATSKGYSKSIEEFTQLISSNQEVLDDNFDYVKTKGYSKDISEFSKLVGFGVKKKEVSISVTPDQNGELSLEDTSLELQEPDIVPTAQPAVIDGFEVVGRNPKEDTYINPTKEFDKRARELSSGADTGARSSLQNQIYSSEEYKKAEAQRKADLRYQKEVEDTQIPEVRGRSISKAQEIDIQLNKESREREGIIVSEDFQTALSLTGKESIGLDEEEAVTYFTDLYGKYGFIFKKAGIGDALEVMSSDGDNHSVDLQTFFSNENEAAELRSFVSKKAVAPLTNVKGSELDNIEKASKVNQIRPYGGRINSDGTESTVLLQQANIDNKNVVYPTIFPRSESSFYGSDQSWWTEKDGMDAYKEALSRGEVFEFDTEEEAAEFAEGSWKDVNTLDYEAKEFFRGRGLDYGTYKKQFDRYEELMNLTTFLEDAPYRSKDLSDQDEKKYSAYYVNGRQRFDIENLIEEFKEEANELRPLVNDSEFRTAREDFDLYLEDGYQQKAKAAAFVNQEAKLIRDNIESQSLQLFNVLPSELINLTGSSEEESNQINRLIESYEESKKISQYAADKYQIAKTWFDAKSDKQSRQQYVENWAGFKNEITKGLANGNVGNEILKASLGINDLDDDATTAEVAEKIVEYLNSGETSRTSRAVNRFHQSRSYQEIWDALKDDPLEISLGLAANSFSQMTPYGTYIIPSSAAAGAATGAAFGGPLAPATGFVGSLQGLKVGFAATNVALEYTNAVMEAARKRYDVMNPAELEKALRDPDVWAEGKDIGLKRGLTIGMVDYLSAGLAGRLFKTSSVLDAPLKKVSYGLLERATYDPLTEATGEFLAQVASGQEISGKEIIAEAVGSFGSNTATAAINVYLDSRANNKVNIANTLSTIDGISKESANDSRIVNWANNMKKLGQIDEEQSQRIIDNVGLRREARDIVNVGNKKYDKGAASVTEVRLMELLAAREELSSTPNRQSVFSSKISEINKEISEIATSKKLRPEKNQTSLAFIGLNEQASSTDIRTRTSKYSINGKVLNKKQFLSSIKNMSSRKLNNSSIIVDNDEEVYNILKDKFNAIQEPSTETVDVQKPSRDSEKMGEGDTKLNQLTKEIETKDKTSIEEAEEKKVVAEEVVIESPFDENNEIDFEADEQVRSIAKKRDLGITRDRELSVVARDKEGNVIGGAFTSYDNNTGEYTFDVVVDDSVEGKGVGSRLLEEVKDLPDEIQDMNPDATVKVDVTNPVMQSMLEKIGFEVVEKTGVDRVSMSPKVETTTKEKSKNEEVDTEALNDLKSILDGNDTQLQLDATPESSERKKNLEDRATKVMEEVQPELSEKSVRVQDTGAKTTAVVVKENSALADKVKKMGLKELIGKTVNLVMADQLKVDEKRMGGPFFPLMKKLFGKVAWASIRRIDAKKIVLGAIGSDYTLVYNMSPSAVDSNIATLNTLIEKIKESTKSELIFQEMMKDIQSKTFKKNKTELIHKIARESNNLEDFVKGFSKLDVDSKAQIFTTVLPSSSVEASTAVGKLFAAEGISQESIRAENTEQFVSDLPMGAITMVLKVTDKQGKPVTKETVDEAIISPEEQEAEGLPVHKNYPWYVRGKAVGIMEETVPFWNLSKKYMNTINAKIDGAIRKRFGELRDKETNEVKREAGTRPTTSAEARGAAMKSAMGSSSVNFEVQENTSTVYQQFIKKLSRAFPNTEVVATEKEFNELVKDLYAKKLTTKSQKIYGAVYKGKLYLNPAAQNYNTPIHEFGHIWANTAKAMNPKLYNRGIDLVKGTQYESDVRNSKSYKKITKQMIADGSTKAEVDQYILEEALATAIGDQGEAFTQASKNKNFKNWLSELFDLVKKLTGISNVTSSQLENMTLEDFTQAVVVDLLSENELFVGAKVAQLSDTLQLSMSSNTSISSIVNLAREENIPDDAIRLLLKERGFRASEITEALKVQRDLLTYMPREFGNVEGGANVGIKLFNEIKDGVKKFSTQGVRGGIGKERTKTFGEIRAKAQELLINSRTYKRQDPQIQMEMRVGLDRQIGIRNNSKITKEIAAIKNILKERKINANNINAAQRRLRRFIRKSLPNSKNYRRKSINKLLKAINETTPTNFVAQAVKVLDVVKEQRQIMKNDLVSKMAALIKAKAKTKKTPSGKRRSGGLDAIGQAYFDVADKIFKLILKNDIEGLQQMQLEINEEEYTNIANEIEAGNEVTVKQRNIYDKQLALDTFSDIMNMELEQVEELFVDIKRVRSESLARLNNRREARRLEVNAIKQKLDSQILNDFDVLFDKEGNPLDKNQIKSKRESVRLAFSQDGFMAGLSEFLNSFMDNRKLNANSISRFMRQKTFHLGTITQILDRNSEGMFNNIFFQQLNDFDENNHKGVKRTESRMNLMADSTTGMPWSKWKYSLGTDVVKYKFKSTKHNKNFAAGLGVDQAMYLYAQSLNDVQRKKLIDQNIDIEAIIKQIGPDNKALVDQSVEFLSNDYFEETNDVYVQANDVNLGYVENYFPTRTLNQSEITSEMIGKGDFNKIFSAEYASALKNRTDKNQDIEIGLSFSEVMEEHVRSMEKYKAYALGVKQMNEILKSQSVQNLLNESGLKSLFSTSLNYAINPESGPSVSNDFVSKAQSAFTGFALAGKSMQIFKQASSFIFAYEKYSATKKPNNIPGLDLVMFVYDYFKVLSNLRSEIKEAREMSALFDSRIKQGLEGDIFGLESGSKTFKKVKAQQGKLGKFKRGYDTTTGLPTVAGDILGVLGYKALYNRSIANGMSKAEALRLFNDYNSTQQTKRATEKNMMQQSNDTFARYFTMFGSTHFLILNNVSQSGMAIGTSIMNKKVPKKSDIRKFALNYSLGNVLWTAMSYSPALLFAKTDKEKDRALRAIRDAALGLNILFQIPIIGAGLENLRNTIDGKRTMSSEGVNPFTTITSKISKGIKEDGKAVGILKPLGGMLIRMDLDAPIALGKLLTGNFDTKSGDGYDLMGASKSYRPGYGMSNTTKSTSSKAKTNLSDIKELDRDLYDEIKSAMKEE